MRLAEIELTLAAATVPAEVALLLADAHCSLDRLEHESAVSAPAFVPSDFELVYRALVEVLDRRLAIGQRFVEWGSGLGVVACLAAGVGFDAVGIEIEPRLTKAARQFARDHGVAVEFVHGSFVPPGADANVDDAGDVTWLSTGGPDGYAELELEPDDFDIVFCYPWPGEEQVVFDLFADCAAVGTLLLTYHGQEGIRLQRKVRR